MKRAAVRLGLFSKNPVRPPAADRPAPCLRAFVHSCLPEPDNEMVGAIGKITASLGKCGRSGLSI